jgi:nucleoside phosphorylase
MGQSNVYRFDFAVIATLDEEFEAVKNVFDLQEMYLKKGGTSKGEVQYYYKEIEGFRVAFFRFSQRGNITSATETREIIDNFKPKYIILVGIAGGVSGNINLGDVAISDDVEYYPYEKVDEGGRHPRKITVEPPSKKLKEIIRYVGDEWRERITAPRPGGGEVKIVHGLILSGEAILSEGGEARTRVQELLERYGKAIAIETEAGGIAEAVYGSSSEYIVIKGVSDYAGESRSQQQRETWRNYASNVAAAFSYGLILHMAKTSHRELLEVRRKLKEYLEEVKKEFEEKSPIDGKPISEYYVESSLKLTEKKTWNKKDEEVKGKEWKVEDFLKDLEEWRIIIGASFGMGKTSFIKYLAKKLAEALLTDMTNYDSYFPIVVKLNRLDDIKSYGIYKQKNLVGLLEDVKRENESRKVLLLLDGLDEYRGSIKDLFSYITDLHNNYKVKVIATSRLVEIPEQYIENYVRLMPFNKEKVNEFFKKYRVNLDYDKCKYLGLKDEEISKPLFCWILGIIVSTFHEIIFPSEWSSEMKKSLLYYIFIHSLIKGKHKKEIGEEFKKYYYIEKEMLRYTAAIKNMLKELDEDKLKSNLKKMNIKNLNKEEVENLEKYLEPLLTSYFYRSSDEMVSRRVDFIHESFKEYLLAEYYYESLMSGKTYRLNVGLPSMETMNFLKGLIEISKSNEAKKILQQIGEDLSVMFGGINKIVENAKKTLEDESLILDGQIDDEECWKIVHPNHIKYEYLWIHRWISLCILKWIKPEEEINKDKIERMIRLTSHTTPSYLKMLEKTNLSGANLEKIDLSRANLYKADLSRANLQEANLQEAKLIGAKLIGTCLSGANLHGANLHGANLSVADLQEADLEKADLEKADLSRANLQEANLQEANLFRTNFYKANLYEANLTFR